MDDKRHSRVPDTAQERLSRLFETHAGQPVHDGKTIHTLRALLRVLEVVTIVVGVAGARSMPVWIAV